MPNSRKNYEPNYDQPLGKLLQETRSGRRFDLGRIEDNLKIRARYISALEAGEYDKLPDDVFIRGFLRNYSRFLGLDPKKTLGMYMQECNISQNIDKSKQTLKPSVKRKRVIVTPRRLFFLTGIILSIGLIGYILYQLSIVAAAPNLRITSPADNTEVVGSSTNLIGKTDGGADVFINGTKIATSPEGDFNETVALQDGVNEIAITAKNKLGKESSVKRTIRAKVAAAVSQSPAAPSDQPPAFKGVEVVVKISKDSSGVTVVSDGQQVFNGTMLPGSTQTFKANDKLQVSVTNSGSVQLIVSNERVLGKDLGVIGSPGNPKRDMVFAKDSQFQ